MVLCLLDPPALLHLHAATGAGMPTVAQRFTTMSAVHHVAHHWHHLSQRLPHHIRKTRRWCSRTNAHAHRSGDLLLRDITHTKQELLEVLRSQISHINDAAAFLHHWVPCQYTEWNCQLHYPDGTGPDIDWPHGDRLDRLNDKIHEALSLGYQGYLDFPPHRKTDPKNMFKEFSAFDGDVQDRLEYTDQLLFVCTLYRLQQLNPEAVLARLHGIFSRCCRYDLLLASRVLCLDGAESVTQAEYQASKQEAPAVDILAAFAQNEPHIRETVSQLTAMQKEEMRSCVQTMVNNHLVHVHVDRRQYVRPR